MYLIPKGEKKQKNKETCKSGIFLYHGADKSYLYILISYI